MGSVMKRFIEGVSRNQGTLFPDCLEDWIEEDYAVRVIEAFVDSLDLAGLGFAGVNPKETGRPSYHPSVLMKLYIYGYLNRVQSSRRLEWEAGRNVEVMRLIGRWVPDHKTIADLRKDNGPGIRRVCGQFVQLCRWRGLMAPASVAIDGSKFKGVNNRDRNFTAAKMTRRQAQIEESIARNLQQLDSADRQEPTPALAKRVSRLHEKIDKLRQEMARLEALEAERQAARDQQISLTDPDARSMATSGRGSGVVGYNTQAAVDTEHHLIVAHDVIQSGSDRAQLAPMAEKAKQALGVDAIDVVCDRGYFSSEQIFECSRHNVTVTMPKPVTTGTRREITRWEHEHLAEAVLRRLDENPQAMRVRRETVEHPFGTIKMHMGATHFLMKRLKNVKTEMALSVLAYNLTRVMNILGPQALIQAMRA